MTTSLRATPSLYQPPIFRVVHPGVMLRRHSVAHLLGAYPGGWHLKRECHGILLSPQERMSTFLLDPGPGCGVHANP